MSDAQIITAYLQKLEHVMSTGDAREHAYRPAFQEMMERLMPDITVINEPAYTGGNAPDFLYKKGETPIAYAECKDITVDLQEKSVQKQAMRYVEAFGKVLLTNYYHFLIIEEGAEPREYRFADLENGEMRPLPAEYDATINALRDYLTPSHRSITSARRLAEIMAHKARILKDNAQASLATGDQNDVRLQYETFREVLIRDLGEEDFCDMYAQTIVYGLFVARYHDPTLPTFSRYEAHELLPKSNPLLKKFFGHVAGTGYDPRIAWIVDSLIEAYLSTDVAGIMHREFTRRKRDPVLHFYETFLTEYDAGLRKNRGVYYTPQPVVDYMVRSVDELLLQEFGLRDGLADTSTIEVKREGQGEDGRTKDGKKYHTERIPRVQILDPAVGTGTFLNEVIHHIHGRMEGQAGLWQSYVRDQLIPRIHGFELMMASYTMAHLKLGITLHEYGYTGEDRLSVWLTNSLEEGVYEVPNLFMAQWLTQESQEASRLKTEEPIMVVIGNPPYSGESANSSEHAKAYVSKYKVEPGGGEKLKERNSKWLNDDYVKFLAMAEERINATGEGITAMITPHGYIDNPTFRGMRWRLRESYDAIYVLDLHGNSNKQETTPEGETDQNVFSIKTGVAIILAVKRSESDGTPATVYRADLWGKQKEKYAWLSEHSLQSTPWRELPAETELWVEQDPMEEEYEKGFSVEEMMAVNGVGIVTAHDNFVIHDDKEVLIQRMESFLQHENNEDSLHQTFQVKKKKGWSILDSQASIKKFQGRISEIVAPIQYRPYDQRYIVYDNPIVWRTVEKVMQHMLRGENVGLIYKRQAKLDFSYIFIANKIVESCLFESAYANNSIAPLYLYAEDGSRTPNLDPEIWRRINTVVGETTPEDILDYIYAVLHSPGYRERYQTLLKRDFPRVPYPAEADPFWRLVPLGRKLRELHLLTDPDVEEMAVSYPTAGENLVEKGYPKYRDGAVSINETQSFCDVPQSVWEHWVGGYQPAQKWLKDRRGRALSYEDIRHYQRMCMSIRRTQEIMQEVDRVMGEG